MNQYGGGERNGWLREAMNFVISNIKKGWKKLPDGRESKFEYAECDLSVLQKTGILKHEGKNNNAVWVVFV